MRTLALVLTAVLLLGCEQPTLRAPPPVTAEPYDLFGPATMRLHPIFTQVKSVSGGAKPDGIEAVVEFDDRFGDATKAAGSVVLELYSYRIGFPDPRGDRLADPWTVPLNTVDQQQSHWRREIGAYSFLLAYDAIHTDRNYVLTATFEPVTGPRLFSQLILSAQPAAKKP
jgi:hypothetical protein